MSERDYIGMRFGTRVCIDQWHVRKRGIKLRVACDCGRISECYANLVERHGCASCGRKEHGHRPIGQATPEYRSWSKMNDRCRNANHRAFARYGGAGIEVCERWRMFSNFLEDMGKKPHARLTLDRIDNSLGYFKENCRWASLKEQNRNKRTNRLVTINGETKCVSEWAEIAGVTPGVMFYRVKEGWPDDRLLIPAEPRKPRSTPTKKGR